jgi:hypothetical protein
MRRATRCWPETVPWEYVKQPKTQIASFITASFCITIDVPSNSHMPKHNFCRMFVATAKRLRVLKSSDLPASLVSPRILSIK